MTAPPGGPYGQDPYGTNPYGQDPYWGGQPQGGPYQQYPQADPYAGAYPPQQQYPPQQYPPQQYPPQQYGPGWPSGPYPPGPPPNGPSSKKPWLIVAGIAVVGVIALVVVLVIALSSGSKSNNAGPSETTSATPEPSGPHTATGCTPNVSGGNKSGGDTISAGKLSFPASVAPGWSEFSDDQNPNLIDAVGVGKEVPGASQWMMQLEVAITNFVPSMDVAAQASTLLGCVANGPGYTQSSPTLGPKKTSSITVDGTKAARVDADVTISDTSHGVKGDTVTIVAVDTKPVTIFLGATPIGDTASAATVNQVIAALKVTKR